MSALPTWLGFSGRLNRTKFWLVSASDVIMLALVLTPLMAAGTTLAWIIFAVGLAVTLPSLLGARIRRLHDQDRSGWWTLLFYGTPTLVAMIGFKSGNQTVMGLLSLLSLALSVWGLYWLGFLRGTAGSNRFGPDPLQAS
jgi:uncharacterized membrane protein YhaH (DUF805 family)